MGAGAGDFVLAPANRRVRDTIIDDATDWLDTLGLDSLHYLRQLAASPASQSISSAPDQLARRALAPLQLVSSTLRGEANVWDNDQDPPPETVRALVEQVARLSNSRSPNSGSLAQRGVPLVQELALTTLDRPEVLRVPRPPLARLSLASRAPLARRAPPLHEWCKGLEEGWRLPSPTLSPTDPVPRGLLTLCRAPTDPVGQSWPRGTGSTPFL